MPSVARRGHAPVRLLVEAHPGIAVGDGLDCGSGAIGGAVIDDVHVKGGAVLGQHAFDGVDHWTGPVVDGDDDVDEGCTGHDGRPERAGTDAATALAVRRAISTGSIASDRSPHRAARKPGAVRVA